ncbi:MULTISPECIES: ArnT family glycosyltransferase [unclassified Coleofasciculus]|uniref:ArnT family glycosyltransferase n=1 Tax=unclassified Coleofasciculus TaxID=2692782 RepID=UPI001D1599C6|nr:MULTISPECIES: glycosyltransferase family 39 protein [unclassified Coleofasciculus]
MTFGLGNYAFYEPHEGHFGGVAYEMLLRGDWITPTLNGSPYLNKPPLLYWLIATSNSLFGVTEYTARLPLALTGWMGAVVAWKWARELWNPPAGRAAALMLCTALGWFLFTHQLLIDVLLATLLLAIYYCLWRLSWEPQCWRYFFSLYLLLGLCLLSKGLLGLVFPVLGCLGLALSRRNWAIFQEIRPVLGVGVMLAVVLPWVIAVERANPGFLHYFLVNEHFKRIADVRWPPDYDVSKVSAWGYLAIAAVWCAPWTLLLPGAIRSAWQDWMQGRRGKALPSAQHRSEGIILLAIAGACPILLFLPLSSRLVYYSIPAVPPLIVLCAGWWSRCQEYSYHKERVAIGILLCILGVGVGSGALWLPSLVEKLPQLPSTVGSLIVAIALALGLGLLGGGSLLLANRPTLSLVGLFVGLAIACITITYGFTAYQYIRSSKALIQAANSCLGLTTLWTFEGSRELGAAGAMSYYLNLNNNDKLAEIPGMTQDSRLPVGWARGKNDTAYRIVMVLLDGGSNRIPPSFPGSRADYALTKQELQEYWDSLRPVVFVTDFLRQPNDPRDPPELNLPDNAGEPLLVIGSRKLYGNTAARERI